MKLTERIPEIIEGLKRGGGAAAAWAEAIEAGRDRLRDALNDVYVWSNDEKVGLPGWLEDVVSAALAKEAGLNIENPEAPSGPSASWSAREP